MLVGAFSGEGVDGIAMMILVLGMSIDEVERDSSLKSTHL